MLLRRTAAAMFVLASGCSSTVPDLNTNDTDRARLNTLMADPWLKPTKAQFGYLWRDPGTRRTGEVVVRGTTTREVDFPQTADLQAAALAEVQTGLAQGWVLVKVICWTARPAPGPSAAGQFTGCRATLAKPTRDLGRAALADVSFDNAYRPDEQNRAVKHLAVTGLVPYHTDQGWPSFKALQLEGTCLLSPNPDLSPEPNHDIPANTGYPLDKDGHSKPFRNLSAPEPNTSDDIAIDYAYCPGP